MGRRALPTDEMNLTEREHRILDFMTQTTRKKGYPPTVREICEYLNIKSTSTVHKDLSALESKGFIRKDPAKPRAIEIVGFSVGSGTADSSDTSDASGARGASGLNKAADAHISDRTSVMDDYSDDYSAISGNSMASDTTERIDVLDIPVIGQVAAGTPILAEENITDSFPIPARYVSNGSNHFMLTVKGESMIEAGIFDGDYILVQQQSTADNGDIVVAMIDGFESEATVKTFFREGDHIRLQPENSSMSPIIVRDVKILGTVRGVFRYFN